MIDEGLVEVSHGKLKLTPLGLKKREEWRVKYYDVRCSHCEGKGIEEDAFGILEDYKKIASLRPKPIAEYDQGHIKEEDVMRRIAFIYERGDLEDTRILVMGDDDLISIGMALTRLPEKIAVLEIDNRLIDFINKVSREYNLPIEVERFDVRHDLSEKYRGNFDVFITDPVETLEGITLFLSRAATSLRGVGSAGYFGLTHLEASLRKWREIEKRLLNMNFAITDMLRDFNVYPMKENLEIAQEDYIISRRISDIVGTGKIDADFYRSTLIRVEAVDNIRIPVVGDVKLKDEIYVDNESLVTAKATRRVK